MPESGGSYGDLSTAKAEQVFAALTGGAENNARTMVKGAEWISFAGGKTDTDPGETFGYYKFAGTWFYVLKPDPKGVRDQLGTEVTKMFDSVNAISGGDWISGSVDTKSLSRAKAAFDYLTVWMGWEHLVFQAKHKTLTSTNKDFKGKAAYVIGGLVGQDAAYLKDLYDQLTTAPTPSTLLFNLRNAIIGYQNAMAAALTGFYADANHDPMVLATSARNTAYDYLQKNGLIAPMGTSPSGDKNWSDEEVEQKLAAFTATMSGGLTGTRTFTGNLMTPGPWQQMNQWVSDEWTKVWEKYFDSEAVRTSITNLNTAFTNFNGQVMTLLEPTKPAPVPYTAPTPKGPEGGNTGNDDWWKKYLEKNPPGGPPPGGGPNPGDGNAGGNGPNTPDWLKNLFGDGNGNGNGSGNGNGTGGPGNGSIGGGNGGPETVFATGGPNDGTGGGNGNGPENLFATGGPGDGTGGGNGNGPENLFETPNPGDGNAGTGNGTGPAFIPPVTSGVGIGNSATTSTKNPDGSTTLSDGTVIDGDGEIHRPDGTTIDDGTVTLPDGSLVPTESTTTLPDGTTIDPDGTTTLPDGTTIDADGNITYPDGTTDDGAAGQDQTLSTFGAADDGTFGAADDTTFAAADAGPIPGDGTVGPGDGEAFAGPDTTTFGDGATVDDDGTTLADGTRIEDDGTTRFPDGTEVSGDGEVTLSDGTRIDDGTITYPDGSVGEVGPDGVTLPDGTVVGGDGSVTLPDGSVVAPDGTTTLPDGTVVDGDGGATLPDGTTVDGDGTVTLPDGTEIPLGGGNASGGGGPAGAGGPGAGSVGGGGPGVSGSGTGAPVSVGMPAGAGAAGAGTPLSATPASAGGAPFFPPMMGGMGGMGGGLNGNSGRERERQTWLSEDEKVWGTDPKVGPSVIGRVDDEDDFADFGGAGTSGDADTPLVGPVRRRDTRTVGGNAGGN
ncbi:hypothetical protein [Cryptosporangium japonicum]|uniref:Uncharacterized protein n=1 Tax=Cryptosporangium japonicum TaxID=80872 RepID=A0ABP3DRA8_9ACTN